MNGFQRRREQKKERVRRAALELFKIYGVNKVSIKDIASKAAVSPTTIYNHFGSKDELRRDVIKQFILSLQKKYRGIIEGEKPFLEKLELIIFDKSEIVSQYNVEFIQTMISDDPEAQQFMDSMFQQEINHQLVDFFEEGKRQGYVNPKLSQRTILLYTDIFRKGLRAQTGLFVTPEYNVELVRELSLLYLYGLMGEGDRVCEYKGIPEGSQHG